MVKHNTNFNLVEFKNFIKDNDISQINIRYTNSLGYWNSLAYDINQLDSLSCGSYLVSNLKLSNLENHRYFIDPFLPHKTLVFLVNNLEYANKSHNKLLDNLTDEVIKLDFYLNEPNLAENDLLEYFGANYDYAYLVKPFDKGADIRVEIVVALNDMLNGFEESILQNNLITKDVVVLSHHHNAKINGHSLFIKNSFDKQKNLDNIQKVKYAILIICHTYNVKVDLDSGIFVDYKNI